MFDKANIKKIALFLSFLLVGFIIFKASSSRAHIRSSSKSMATVDSHRAELSLRAADAINLLPSSPIADKSRLAASNEPTDEEFTSKLKIGKSGVLATEAENTLEHANQEDKQNPIILARKIILESELNESTRDDLEQLASACLGNQKKQVLASVKLLAPALQLIYGTNQSGHNIKPMVELESGLLARTATTIEKTFSPGWFKERALLKLYKISQQPQNYRRALEAIKNKTWQFLFKVILLVSVGTVLMLVGLLIIIWQFCFSRRRKDVIKADNPLKESVINVSYGWQTVLLVFYAWFCTQIFFGLFVVWLKRSNVSNMSVGQHPIELAASIALIYMLSNGPALLYIYFFVLKPRKITFLNGINFRLKNGFAGLLRLIAIACLAWIAAIPLVVFSYFLSLKLFNATGSSNPIIAMVMEAASTDSLVTILLFYLTLGVLAPFVEESLFRGFFYTFLRSRYGVIFSNILSAGLFAAVHLDPGAVLPLFCLGIIFAYLFEITGSTIPGMIAHGLWNSGTFTIVLLLFRT